MKLIILTSLMLIPFGLESADTPSRWAGLFGFGSSKQKEEQISADLFPAGTASGTQGSSSPPPTVASPVSGSTEDSIFRSGGPQPVEPVSYAIENGQKVEKEVEKKKGSIFSFGKRSDSDTPENQVLAPVPVAAVPVQAAPIVAVPNPVPARPAPAIIATPTSAPPITSPAMEEQKEQRFSWIPFLSKKKDEAPIPAPVNPVAAQTATPVTPEVVPSNTSTVAVTAANGTAKPTAATGEPGAPSFEVPKKDQPTVEKPKSEGGGILAPIANLRPPRKPIDLTNAETIIQNGEIVAASENSFDSAPASTAPADRRPPAVVNGVKTYSSWDDVGGQSTSAADRIINQIR